MSKSIGNKKNKHSHAGTGMQPNLQRRKSHRIRCFVKITVENLTRQTETGAKCTNISFGGMSVEFLPGANQNLFSGDNLRIKIYLSDELNPINRIGKVAWIKKDNRGNWQGGIEFIPEEAYPKGDLHAMTI